MHSGIEQNFKVDFSTLGEYITPKTKLIIFSSPCNPSGTVYSKDELKQLADVLVKHPNVYVISDEIYEHISYTDHHESLGQFSEIYEQLITVNGVSKGYAMTGWRIGYIGAPLHIAQAAGKIQGQITSGTCSIAQLAAQAAVEADPIVIKEMLEAFKFRRGLILDLLQEIPGLKCNVPEGAFYVFPEVSSYFGTEVDGRKIADAVDLSNYILEVGHVALVPGNAFGSPECIRISYAASEKQIREAVSRIKSVLEKLTRS
jgi:aspartate aminotransferase